MGIVFGITNCAHSTFCAIALLGYNICTMIVRSNLNVVVLGYYKWRVKCLLEISI